MGKYYKFFHNVYLLSLLKKFNTIVFGLLSTMLLHRIMTPEMKGEYVYINDIVVTLTNILNFGISLVLPNYVRKKNNWTESTFYALSVVQFLFHSIVSAAIGLVSGSASISLYGFATACGVFSLQILNSTMIYNFTATVIANSIGVIANAAFLGVIYLTKIQSINSVFIALIVKELLCAGICLFSVAKQFHFSEINVRMWPKILFDGLLPMLMSLMVILNYKVDVFELKWLGIPEYNIGIYSVGLNLADYVLLISDIFKDVLFHKTAKKDDIDTVNFSMRICSTIMVSAYTVLILFGKLVIRILYGPAYLEAYIVTIIVIFGTFSMMYFKLLGTLFIAQGKWWFYFIILSGSVLINIVSNYLLIPLLGIYGAALTSLLSYSFTGIVFVTRYLKEYHLHVRQVFLLQKQDVQTMIGILMKKKA